MENDKEDLHRLCPCGVYSFPVRVQQAWRQSKLEKSSPLLRTQPSQAHERRLPDYVRRAVLVQPTFTSVFLPWWVAEVHGFIYFHSEAIKDRGWEAFALPLLPSDFGTNIFHCLLLIGVLCGLNNVMHAVNPLQGLDCSSQPFHRCFSLSQPPRPLLPPC